jgi:hypothetical protein
MSKVLYSGPAGQFNDALGGVLEPGKTYDAPKGAVDELLAHPAGWFSQPPVTKKERANA